MPPLWFMASTRLPGLMPFLGKLPEFLVKAWKKQALMVVWLVILHCPGKGSEPGSSKAPLLLELKTEMALITVTGWSTLDYFFQQFPTSWRYSRDPCRAVCFLV